MGGEARLEFTFAANILHYVQYLKFTILAPICTLSPPSPFPKGNLTQFWFCSKSLPFISDLHSIRYTLVDGNYIKILPSNIQELYTPIALAPWIMDDGYFTSPGVYVLIILLKMKFYY